LLNSPGHHVRLAPGSGLIRVFLSETDNCFYNPASGLFSTAPVNDGAPLDLITHHLPELKQKLNKFDAQRRAYIARYNQFSAAL
jgi:hypothetical protein